MNYRPMLYSKCNENTKTQRAFLIEIFILDEQLLWQLNRIRPMVTLDIIIIIIIIIHLI